MADYRGNADEGMKITALRLGEGLAGQHKVKRMNMGDIGSLDFWKACRGFRPQIIHYVPGPSILSFVVMKALKGFCPGARTVISATHPSFFSLRGLGYGPYYALSSLLTFSIPALKPDLILVHSHETERMFQRWGCRTRFLPSGVDTTIFSPVSLEAKERLRGKYGIGRDKFVVCHAGSAGKWRNIKILGDLQTEDTQVVLLAGGSTVVDEAGCRELQEKGCLVWRDYLPSAQEIYQLSDCYVFPTADRRGSIELPLSVLEAMACNLPVVSIRFGALPRVFEEGDGLIFVDDRQSLLEGVARVQQGGMEIETRSKVLPLSWEKVVGQLEEIYAGL